MWPFPSPKDIAEGILTTWVGWMSTVVLEIIKQLWRLLAGTAFTTPDVSALPQVTSIVTRSVMVVNVCFILAILTAGIVVMTRDTVQSRYGVADLVPRLVVGWIAANFAVPICRSLIELANAFTQALTGDGVTSQGSLNHLAQVTSDSLRSLRIPLLAVVMGLLLAVMTGMLLLTWLVRIGVLIVLVGVSPVALACHATPFTDGAARLWWRSLAATLATVVLQAITLHTALSVFLDPDANLPTLGLPDDPTGTLNLFIVVCLLWVVIKIPGLMRRYATRGGGGTNVGGLIVRTVLVQQLTSMLRTPLRRPGGGRAAAAGRGGGGAGRAGAAGGGGGPRGGGGGPGPRPLGGGGSPAPGGGRASLPRPRGAGQGRVGVAWPTGRSVPAYTREQLAAGVDPYTATVRKAAPQAPAAPRSTRPPIRAAGVAAPPPAGPRPVLPSGVNPATVMPKTRPVWPPVRGPWTRPPRPSGRG
jgi:hypothetical protein